jgi:formiminotetrahydrofolate cyclodeaminase
MKLANLTIKNFEEELASGSPAPGGGSVAALCGTLGAALIRMISNLTLGRKKFADAHKRMTDTRQSARDLAEHLLELVDEDTLSYNRVIDAYKLPKDSSAAAQLRLDAIQDALKAAADIPMQTLRQSANAMPLVKTVIRHGNPNCITDAGVAAELISTAVRGAAYNIFINLADITDPVFVVEMKQKTKDTLNKVEDELDKIRKMIASAVNMEENRE